MPPVNAILEGPDGAGKDYRAEQFGLTPLHFGPMLRRTTKTLFNYYLMCLVRYPTHSWNRCWYSELIYGMTCRGMSRLTSAHLRLLDRVALGQGKVLIHCQAPDDALTAVTSSREEYPQDEQHEEIRGRYRDLQEFSHLPYIPIDRETTVQAVVERVVANRYVNYGPGIGAWREGQTLLLGDRPNGKLDTPFVKVDGCSPWLAEQLDSIHWDERNGYWANAFRADGQEQDPIFLEDLRPGKIIALGKQAERWCRKHGLEHLQVPHPQYWKRFRQTEPYPLLEVLT